MGQSIYPAAAVGTQPGQLYQTKNISNISTTPWQQITPVTPAPAPPPPPSSSPVKLNQISYSNGRICGVDSQYNIWCNTAGYPNNFNKIPNGQLKNISLYGNSAMGTNSANQIWYTPNIFVASPTWYKLNGNLNSVNQSAYMACGLDQNQAVWCNYSGGSGAYNNTPNFNMESEHLQELSIYGQSGMGIGVGGNSIYYNPPGAPVGAPWQQYCTANTCPGKLPLKNISQTNSLVCVNDSLNNIYCKQITPPSANLIGSTATTPQWLQVQGASSQVILDNFPVGQSCSTGADCNSGVSPNYNINCCSNKCQALNPGQNCP